MNTQSLKPDAPVRRGIPGQSAKSPATLMSTGGIPGSEGPGKLIENMKTAKNSASDSFQRVLNPSAEFPVIIQSQQPKKPEGKWGENGARLAVNNQSAMNSQSVESPVRRKGLPGSGLGSQPVSSTSHIKGIPVPKVSTSSSLQMVSNQSQPESSASKWGGSGSGLIAENSHFKKIEKIEVCPEYKEMRKKYSAEIGEIIKKASDNPVIAIGVRLQNSGSGFSGGGVDLKSSYYAATHAVVDVIRERIPATCDNFVVAFSCNPLKEDGRKPIEDAATARTQGGNLKIDISYIQEYGNIGYKGMIYVEGGESRRAIKYSPAIALIAETQSSVIAGNSTETWVADFFKECHSTPEATRT
jgi:hypothetical protein